MNLRFKFQGDVGGDTWDPVQVVHWSRVYCARATVYYIFVFNAVLFASGEMRQTAITSSVAVTATMFATTNEGGRYWHRIRAFLLKLLLFQQQNGLHLHWEWCGNRLSFVVCSERLTFNSIRRLHANCIQIESLHKALILCIHPAPRQNQITMIPCPLQHNLINMCLCTRFNLVANGRKHFDVIARQ